MDKLLELKKKENNARIKWGFFFALLTALAWGLWYTPGTVIWEIPPITDMNTSTIAGTLVTAILITSLTSIFVLLFLAFVWNGIQGNITDIARTALNFKLSKWFFAGALLGGPVAIIGSYLATGIAGPLFASSAAMIMPVIGTIASSIWFKEKVTKRMAIGMAIIILGGIINII